MEKKKVIGIDFDDVLFDFYAPLFSYKNMMKGTTYQVNSHTCYDLYKTWECTPEEASQWIYDFYATEHHNEVPPITGAVDAISALKEDHALVIITARPESMHEKTQTLLHRHFPDVFDSIHYTNHYGDGALVRTKREVCEELGVDVFIDDALHNAIDIAAPHRPVLLLDNPWNQAETPEHVRRVHSWDEILDILK